MPVRLVTGPAEEPLTLQQAKDHLRLETDLDDDYLESLLIPAARQYLERVCWRGFLLQTWELTLPGFRGEDRLDLAPDWRSPVGAFADNWLGITSTTAFRFNPYLELIRGHLANTPNVSIVYLDAAGAPQTLSASAYLLQNIGNDSMVGRVWLNELAGFAWPDTARRFDAVKVTYTVGWDGADSVPAPLKQAMLIVLAQMYEHRTPEIDGRLSEAEFTSSALIAPYRFLRL